MLAEFGEITRTVDYAEPQLKLVSNLAGELLTDIKADYWVEHVRQPVCFAQGMTTLAKMGIDTFIEIGPKPILLGLGQQCLSDQVERLWLPSLYPNQQSDWAQNLESLAKLHVRGGQIDWQAFDKPYPRRKLSLPTYPFQRKRYWVDRLTTTSRQRQAGHPLLGEQLQPLATNREIAFQNQISATYPAYLNDHQVYEQVIVPATAYLEMALSAGKQIYTGGYVLQNVTFLQPLVLSETSESTVQLVLSPADNGYQWQIFSLKQDINEWQLHVSGELISLPDENEGNDYSLQTLRQHCAEEIALSVYETSLPEGIYFGPDFQGLTQLFRGEKEALGLIKLPESLVASEYQIHPVLLDCCVRINPINQADDRPYLPFSCEQVKLFTNAPLTSVWSYVKWQDEISGTRQMDITLFDEAGQVVAELSGFGLRQANRQAIIGSALRTDWLYELVWLDAPLPQKSPYADKPGRWLIVSEQTDLAKQLAQLLRIQGAEIEISTAYQLANSYQGVIYLAGLMQTTDVPEMALDISSRVLELVKRLIQTETVPSLCLVTEGKVEQSVLWGFARTLMWEYPQLNSRCVELKAGATAERLFDAIWYADGENQIRLDEGHQRQVARLEQLKLSALGANNQPYPFRVQLEQYGLLDSLQLVPDHRQEPQANQVEVQVRAVGLNFRDVLNALGMLKSYYPPELGFDDPKKVPFGFESTGVIARIGDEVTEFQVGDDVIVWQYFGSLATFITVDSEQIGKKPKHLSFEEAATIPVTFLTAYYALIELADMRAGDKVLIHAAAGGVGQAAVQLAQYIGAEIFATASLPKWDFLKSQGIDHIMDSRTLEFADQLKELTHGKGVDIVLNSLNGEYIQKNFDVLAENGRFIEMSKIDIWDAEQAGSYRPDVKYAPFDLSETSDMEFRTQLEELLVEKKISSLPNHVFSIEEVSEAFQFMAQAKHIGKVVLSMPAQQQPTEHIKSNKSYLITGGLGGLGLKMAEWLVTQGATHLVLSSRRCGAAAQSAIADLESKGTKIKVVKADVSQAEEVKNLLQTSQEFAPLKGIIHAAGVLDDGVVSQQTPARFVKVFAPKVLGTWYLHQYSQGIPLDFFVCFSSQTSLLGNGGQVSYASANAFMDTLMHQRNQKGLPALSINWGGWSEVGMAKKLVEAISPKQGVELFGALLSQDVSQVGVFPNQWQKFSQKLPSLAGFPVLSKLIKPKSTTSQSTLQQLSQVSAKEQYEILKKHIKSEIELIVGTVPADEQNFFDLGMDSLMSIQLGNRLASELQLSLPAMVILQYPTLNSLSQFLLEQFKHNSDSHAVPSEKPVTELLQQHTYSCPLSNGQQALWFIHQNAPDSPAYNLAFSFELQGNLNLTALQQVLQALVNRHPVLRATIQLVDEEPMQTVQPTGAYHWNEHQAIEWSEQQLWSALKKAIEEPFDLTRESVLRANLFQTHRQRYILILAMHHIWSDGNSVNILANELLTLYQAELSGKKVVLPSMPTSYADFVRAEKAMLNSPTGKELVQYWQHRLGDENPILNLPTDYPRPAVQSYNGASVPFCLPAKLSQQLKKLAQQEKSTPFSLFLTVFQTLLYRYTGQTEIWIGTATSTTRHHQPQFANLIGYLVNPVVLRATIDPAANLSFRELLSQTKQTALEATEYSTYPFPLLVKTLQPHRDLSYAPLFQVMLDFISADLLSLKQDITGLTVSVLELAQMEGQFDLTLNIREGEQFKGSFNYNIDLFKPETIERMVRHFEVLLGAIVENPEQSINQLPMLTENEVQQLQTWNETATDFPIDKTIVDLFEQQVEKTPENIAVVFETQELSYEELNRKANQIAHYLMTLGVKPEVLVGICVERSIEMMIGLLGILKTGGAYVPIDPSYPQARIGYMLDDSAIPLLLTQSHLKKQLPELEPECVVVCLDEVDFALQAINNPAVSRFATDLAYVIYTSGSTGKPKGVMVEHHNLSNFLRDMQQRTGIIASDKLLAVTTLSFDIAALELYLPLISGSLLYLATRETASDGLALQQQLMKHDISFMQATPATWQLLKHSNWQAETPLNILCGGEALSSELANYLLENGNRLWNVYGPTETTVWSSAYPIKTVLNTNSLIGQPIANTRIYILDTQHQPQPPGIHGELCIAGRGLARGYLNRPELTSEKFIEVELFGKTERIYKTGDKARWLPDGNLEYLGRIDHQIKLRGFRIELGEIEAVLSQHEAVKEAVVILYEADDNKRLVAYLTTVAKSNVELMELKDWLKTRLPDYMIPSHLTVLEQLPLTPNGKIDRKALPTPDASLSNALHEPPSDEVEQNIAMVWQQVLKQENLSIHDSFFELGGHSLLVMQVHRLLQQNYHTLKVVDLFSYPTIHTLANYLTQNPDSTQQRSQQRGEKRRTRRRVARQRKHSRS